MNRVDWAGGRLLLEILVRLNLSIVQTTSLSKMPENCQAIGCNNEATAENRAKGISFHNFPKDPDMRKK